jgi:RNA-directed DNA polymerase
MGGTSWIGQSRSTFRKGKCGKRTRGLELITERQASTASRLRTSRLIFPTTSTSSGIGFRRAVIIRRQCEGLIYLKEMGEEGRGHWEFPVADRIAQTVVKRQLEPLVEPCFHQDSYGYRPGKSALDAVGVARQRCWRHAWVLDLDIQSFFDRIDSNLLMRAVRKHTDCPWVLLYIERWLKAPIQMADGSLVARERGTPQGGVISPILSNLFLHYTFDIWMRRNHPAIPFERYADDVICHCRSEEQARTLRASLETRFAECGLTLHPDKTKVVYCKDDDRRGDYPDQKFDFLGYTFRPRLSRRRNGFGVSFSPAVSGKALKSIRQTVRHWILHERSDKTLDDLARMFNNHIRGWINYYGRFYKSALYPVLRYIDRSGIVRRNLSWLSDEQ